MKVITYHINFWNMLFASICKITPLHKKLFVSFGNIFTVKQMMILKCFQHYSPKMTLLLIYSIYLISYSKTISSALKYLTVRYFNAEQF